MKVRISFKGRWYLLEEKNMDLDIEDLVERVGGKPG
jgi:hypothetical protein